MYTYALARGNGFYCETKFKKQKQNTRIMYNITCVSAYISKYVRIGTRARCSDKARENRSFHAAIIIIYTSSKYARTSLAPLSRHDVRRRRRRRRVSFKSRPTAAAAYTATPVHCDCDTRKFRLYGGIRYMFARSLSGSCRYV